jgi:PiT family inorganic phosphate transporter
VSLFDGTIGWGTLALLFVCFAIALSFEFVNGFHDTANAVATVIYTRSLKPWTAVIWSGLMNFLGVLLGGAAVAFSIVHPLPVDLLINIGTMAANMSGLQLKTILNIALAWGLTMPVTMLLAGMLFAGTACGAIKESGNRAVVPTRQELRKVD